VLLIINFNEKILLRNTKRRQLQGGGYAFRPQIGSRARQNSSPKLVMQSKNILSYFSHHRTSAFSKLSSLVNKCTLTFMMITYFTPVYHLVSTIWSTRLYSYPPAGKANRVAAYTVRTSCCAAGWKKVELNEQGRILKSALRAAVHHCEALTVHCICVQRIF